MIIYGDKIATSMTVGKYKYIILFRMKIMIIGILFICIGYVHF